MHSTNLLVATSLRNVLGTKVRKMKSSGKTIFLGLGRQVHHSSFDKNNQLVHVPAKIEISLKFHLKHVNLENNYYTLYIYLKVVLSRQHIHQDIL